MYYVGSYGEACLWLISFTWSLSETESARKYCEIPLAIFQWCHLIKLAHSSLGYWEYIFITHLVIFIQSEVSTFPIIIIFSMDVCLQWLYHNMLLISYISQECWVLFLLLQCSLMMCTNNRVLVKYILVNVCTKLSQFSQLSSMQYMGLCIFSLLISLLVFVRIL